MSLSARTGAFLLALASTTASAAPLKLPGFPVRVDGPVRGAVAIVDLERDGRPEMVVEHGGKVSVFNSDGKPLPGSPIDVAKMTGAIGAGVVGAPAVGDIDADGTADIVVAFTFGDMADGAVVAVRADGRPLWPKPYLLPKGPGAGPSIADVNGDGKADVIVGGRSGQLLVLNQQMQPLPGFPFKFEGKPSSPVSFGMLAKGQPAALAFGTEEGRLYAVHTNGKPAKGFPVETRYAITGAPAFGDIDNDNEHELVVASQDFKVYAYNADGSLIGGGQQPPLFPVSAGYRIYGGPALADLDKDGALDIVVGSGDGKIYAWTARGKLLPGWPVAGKGRLGSSVVVGDTDRDGFDEVFAVFGDGNLYAFDHKARPVIGFPLAVAGEQVVMGNLVADPNVEFLVGSGDGTLHGYRMARVSEMPLSALSWPAPAHDATRQGRFGPNAPRYREVALTPDKPHAGDAVKLSYAFFDLDGDPEPKTLIRWSLNGKHQPDLDGKRELPGALVKKAQQWKAVVQAPEDYVLYKEGPAAALYGSPVITVLDTPPTTPTIAIKPGEARITDALSVDLVSPSADVDGDAIRYKYAWFRDGEPVSDKPGVEPKTARKGERWRVKVTPTDGELDGVPAEAEITILNALPTAPAIALSSESIPVDGEVSVKVTTPSTDADGDPLAYRYAFLLGGRALALPPEQPTFPKFAARSGDTLTAQAWAVDDEAEGPRTTASFTIVNTAPPALAASIAPAKPGTNDTLTAGLLRSGRDTDGDKLAFELQWLRNGEPFGRPGDLAVPPGETKKGDRFAVELRSKDAKESAPVARAEATILNSPPSAPRLAATLLEPRIDEASTLSIAEPASDPDGDTLRYEWSWSVDGKRLPGTDKTTLAPGEFKKGQKWLVEVVAIDPDGARGPAATLQLRPKNSTPATPAVALEPARPTTLTGLKAVVTAPAADRDGDTISYSYRWFRNGIAAPEAGNGPLLAPGTIKHDEAWRVVVTALDGEAEGAPVEASSLVVNVPPAAPKVALTARPTVLTGLTCDLAEPPVDADGDPLVLERRWFRGDQPFPAAADLATIPGDALTARELWRCDVVVRDAVSQSPLASAKVTVENVAPSSPKVAIAPAVPRTGDALTCAVVEQARDPENDRIAYAFRWTAPAGVQLGTLADPARIPGNLVRKGQPWRCEVVANDASSASPSAVSAEVRVANTPPKAPRLKLQAVPAGTELKCELIDPVVDADGDAVTLAYAWLRNGERQSFAETSATVPGRMVKAGDRWRCSATAADRDAAGGNGRSPETTIPGTPVPAPYAR